MFQLLCGLGMPVHVSVLLFSLWKPSLSSCPPPPTCHPSPLSHLLLKQFCLKQKPQSLFFLILLMYLRSYFAVVSVKIFVCFVHINIMDPIQFVARLENKILLVPFIGLFFDNVNSLKLYIMLVICLSCYLCICFFERCSCMIQWYWVNKEVILIYIHSEEEKRASKYCKHLIHKKCSCHTVFVSFIYTYSTAEHAKVQQNMLIKVPAEPAKYRTC